VPHVCDHLRPERHPVTPVIALTDLAAETPLALSVAATGAGALQGALIARSDDDLDHVGMATLAICVGFGGGIIRDVLLGTFPPTALTNTWFIGVVLGAVLIVSLVGQYLQGVESVLLVADAAVLGLFGVIAAQQAVAAGLPFLAVCFVGVSASVGGGVVADVLRGERPMIMRPGPPYALVSVAGVCTYAVLVEGPHVEPAIASVIAIVVTFVGRLLTFRLGVRTRAARSERWRR
jgi:uncharacterized membrane protein YeiH